MQENLKSFRFFQSAEGSPNQMIKAGGALQELLHDNKQLVAGFSGNQKRHISVILINEDWQKPFQLL